MPLSGLQMLEDQGKLRFSFSLDRENRRGLPYAQLLEAEGGGRRIIFDLSDGYGSVEKRAQPWLAERADILFRRSFSPAETAKLPPALRGRVRPWGFHFHVSCPGNPMDQVTSLGERKGELFQWIFNGAPRSYFTLEKFERPPEWKREPSVLFYTRLWHVPEGDELSEQVAALNRSRLELVAELKRRYGRRFTGGVQFDPRAVRRYGGLMSGIAATSRRRYLETMHRADICVGSTGLHGSIGWKTAEYLAASKAVVNETLQFEVPGPFQAGVNYLPFTDAEGCLAQVERLMADPDRTYAMAQANQAYYQFWGRPDRVMANALAQVFPGFECEVGNG
ncbi:hypothetical protein N510_000046 [Firmicutes bacterium ASF500]|nr:hypothetical protein N510_000046 [Firmicutes bacterium ASF500]